MKGKKSSPSDSISQGNELVSRSSTLYLLPAESISGRDEIVGFGATSTKLTNCYGSNWRKGMLAARYTSEL